MSKLTEQEANALAYELNNALQFATEKFMREHPKANITVALGAANIYMATMLCNAPTKQQALETLPGAINIVTELIKATPDAFFSLRNSNNINLN